MIPSRRRLSAAVAMATLALASLHGCTSSDEQKIIGAWIDTEEGYVIEFLPNGTVQAHDRDGTPAPGSAKWALLDDGRLKIDVVPSSGTSPRSELAAITFETDGRLVLLPVGDGKPSTMQRLEMSSWKQRSSLSNP